MKTLGKVGGGIGGKSQEKVEQLCTVGNKP